MRDGEVSYHRVTTGKEPLTYPQLIGGLAIVGILVGSFGYWAVQVIRAVWS